LNNPGLLMNLSYVLNPSAQISRFKLTDPFSHLITLTYKLFDEKQLIHLLWNQEP